MNMSHNEEIIPEGENADISFSPFLKAGNDDILKVTMKLISTNQLQIKI